MEPNIVVAIIAGAFSIFVAALFFGSRNGLSD